jgi:hypothetical protein
MRVSRSGDVFLRLLDLVLKLGNEPTALIDDVFNVCLSRHHLASLEKECQPRTTQKGEAALLALRCCFHDPRHLRSGRVRRKLSFTAHNRTQQARLTGKVRTLSRS